MATKYLFLLKKSVLFQKFILLKTRKLSYVVNLDCEELHSWLEKEI